jgi:hypothetical protein
LAIRLVPIDITDDLTRLHSRRSKHSRRDNALLCIHTYQYLSLNPFHHIDDRAMNTTAGKRAVARGGGVSAAVGQRESSPNPETMPYWEPSRTSRRKARPAQVTNGNTHHERRHEPTRACR